jgi:hypothetical protein
VVGQAYKLVFSYTEPREEKARLISDRIAGATEVGPLPVGATPLRPQPVGKSARQHIGIGARPHENA